MFMGINLSAGSGAATGRPLFESIQHSSMSGDVTNQSAVKNPNTPPMVIKERNTHPWPVQTRRIVPLRIDLGVKRRGLPLPMVCLAERRDAEARTDPVGGLNVQERHVDTRDIAAMYHVR